MILALIYNAVALGAFAIAAVTPLLHAHRSLTARSHGAPESQRRGEAVR